MKNAGVLFSLLFISGLLACDTADLNQPSNNNTSSQFRTISGHNNNLAQADWGMAEIQLGRIAPAAYSDGVSTLAGASRPNPRTISQILFDQNEDLPNNRNLTNMVWQWGQFLDHDIDLTPAHDPIEPEFILVPLGDPFFDPSNLGNASIPFMRSSYDSSNDANTPREQLNHITSFIDGSQIYGSDETRANWLRLLQAGELVISDGNMLPFNDGSMANEPNEATELYVAGDVRANEQIGLTALHILFMREHNRLCAELKKASFNISDEELYQQARKWVGAFIQAITYNEFLPALLGDEALGPYQGYNPSIDPSILNSFSTAFFRIGHTMISEDLWLLDIDGNPLPENPLPLREAFFNPQQIISLGGIEPILHGLIQQPMQEIDTQLVDSLRNFLFGAPGSGGLDLAALNIQRGRDHGLPDYNSLRQAFGLTPLNEFSEITSQSNLANALEDLYGDINDLDPWVGALAEDHIDGSSTGPLLATALKEQFKRLRHGDRFWYENDPFFSAQDRQIIHQTKLSDIIRRNTNLSILPVHTFSTAP